MQRGIGAEQWAAIRALREDALPTFSLLATATGLNVSTLRERAAREGWKKQPFQSAVQRAARTMALERSRADPRAVLAWAEGRLTVLALLAAAEREAEAAAAGGTAQGDASTGGATDQGPGADDAAGAGRAAVSAAAAGEGAALGEKLEKLAGLLARQVDAIVDAAGAAGARLDRQGIDEVAALLRLSEKALSLAPGGRGADEIGETRSDDELAAMLALLDDRVVELAARHADWLVAGKDRERG
ncbi:MAG TPA: hypothetical protein GYA10_07620 [Alphaproteobacteria bacterium]|nr:hypothetical protein [Alphaproteobacteria bacterium]